MKKNITATMADKLKPQDKPYEVRDTNLKGLLLRVQPYGTKTYFLEFKRGKRKCIGRADAITPYQARELARNVLKDVYGGIDPMEKKPDGQEDTYIEFLDKVYKPWLALNLVHGRLAYDTLKHGFPELHKLKLNEITPGVIEKWRTRRLNEGVKPITLNRQLSDLKACLNRAVDKFEMIDANPIAKVKPTKTDNSPKVRYLTKDEEISLRQALDEREERITAGRESGNQWRAERGHAQLSDLHDLAFVDYLKPAVLLSLNTGLRRGELLKLKWEDVHFEQRNLTVSGETSKTGKTRHVPLNDEALAVLRQWKEQPGVKSRYVFTDAVGQQLQGMKTSWNGALRLAKITNFRWHDLRHSFASKLVMTGTDLNTVRELLGHSDYKMTLRYAHLAPEHKAAAVARLVAYQQQVG
jgi:integrase